MQKIKAKVISLLNAPPKYRERKHKWRISNRRYLDAIPKISRPSIKWVVVDLMYRLIYGYESHELEKLLPIIIPPKDAKKLDINRYFDNITYPGIDNNVEEEEEEEEVSENSEEDEDPEISMIKSNTVPLYIKYIELLILNLKKHGIHPKETEQIFKGIHLTDDYIWKMFEKLKSKRKMSKKKLIELDPSRRLNGLMREYYNYEDIKRKKFMKYIVKAFGTSTDVCKIASIIYNNRKTLKDEQFDTLFGELVKNWAIENYSPENGVV